LGIGQAAVRPGPRHRAELIVHADLDRDCPIELSRAVFAELKSAPYRRWVEIGGARTGFHGEQPLAGI
jgi:hypothetical protein